MDLCGGFQNFKNLDDTADDHLNSLLKRLIALEKETGTKVEADIVAWRGMLTKVRILWYYCLSTILIISDNDHGI